MATAWQTLEEAALTLGISSRTLHRRLSKGEFETRLENGRREVLVTVSDTDALADASVHARVRAELSAFANRAAALADRASQSSDPLTDKTDSDVSHHLQSEGPSSYASDLSDMTDHDDPAPTTMLALHEDRIHRTDLAIMAYQQSVNVVAADSLRAHRSAKLAWSLAACGIVALFTGGIWATHSLTRANAEVDHLHQVVRQLSDTSDARLHESEQLRQQAETARLASARLEGELSAARNRIDQITTQSASDKPVNPSTQPTSSGAMGAPMEALIRRLTLR